MNTFTANQSSIFETAKSYVRCRDLQDVTPDVLANAIRGLTSAFKVSFTDREFEEVLHELIRHYSVFTPA